MGWFRRNRDEPTSGSPEQDPEAYGPPWQGRGLRLPAPPDAAHASENADRFVDTVRTVDGIHLDYSIDSLQWVDHMLDTFRTEGSDAMAETIFLAGCYVGETMVRAHDFTWTDFDETTRSLLGFPFGVVAPRGSFANPVGKAFKRVDSGPGDDIGYFVQVMAEED